MAKSGRACAIVRRGYNKHHDSCCGELVHEGSVKEPKSRVWVTSPGSKGHCERSETVGVPTAFSPPAAIRRSTATRPSLSPDKPQLYRLSTGSCSLTCNDAVAMSELAWREKFGITDPG